MRDCQNRDIRDVVGTMKEKILVVDDDPGILLLFERILTNVPFQVTTGSSVQEALAKMQAEDFDLIISDQVLGDGDGLQILQEAHKETPGLPFIMISGAGTIPKVVESMKKGAVDYISKPLDNNTILNVVHRTLTESAFRIRESLLASKEIIGETIIGNSAKMQELFRLIARIAKTTATVLIEGESGTGKELIARAIHRLSPRQDTPFIPINCAYLSENLLENELFGHVQGAFTGAVKYKKGLLAETNHGTLFLDEVGDIPLPVQTKLLRVLQEKQYKPLGSNETIQVDMRIIAATNIRLQEAVQEKRFREDLYYRLAVIPIFIPPLRDRLEDVPLLAKHFARKYGKENGKEIQTIAPETLEKLVRYHWPGNVRELENTIARSVALATGNSLTPELLWQGVGKTAQSPTTPLQELIERDTKEAILQALKLTEGNLSKTARILGISRQSLYQKMKQFDVSSPKKTSVKSGKT